MSNISNSSQTIEATMSIILATAFAILVGMHFIQQKQQETSKIKSQPEGSGNNELEWECSKCNKINTTAKRCPNCKSWKGGKRNSSAVIGERTRESNTQSGDSNAPTNNLPLQYYIPILLPSIQTQPSKYYYEVYNWYYTIIWIVIFGYIVISQCYENFTAYSYLIVCGGLALPLLLQPFVYPQASSSTTNKEEGTVIINPDVNRPCYQRYSTKATLYLLTYSFIGNYWYTHYFYSVLKARYTMPSHRFNNVPIAMFLATHFYFCTYHVCISNGLLRYVDVTYARGWKKTMLFVYTILFLSYFTAFMETLTISSFPYYTFEDRTVAYIWGSAF